MSFPRYERYKESGVEWLGEVPVGWEVKAIKQIVATPITDGPHETPIFLGEGIPFVSAEAVSSGKIDFKKIRGFISESVHKGYSQKYCPQLGDIYMVKSGATTGITAIVDTDTEFNIWSPLAAIRCGEKAMPRFVLNFMRSKNFQEAVTLNWSFGTQQNIGMRVIENLSIALPPLPEQHTIAAFLDRETGKIDALVMEQERLIALLKEQRQAVISHAVTKGLNPDAPMKDSGVEWLGLVPRHWKTRSIAKASTKITNGYVGPTRDILVEAGVPYIQATHIKKGIVNFDDAYFVTLEWSNMHSKSILAKGDILIVQTGAGTGDVGLVSEREVGFNCHALIIVTPDKHLVLGTFLSAVLQSTYGQEKLSSIKTGAMHPHLNCGEVKFVEVPLPPLSEQSAIVAFLDSETAKIDTLVGEARQAIGLLKERRSALISAAVTGKIDVRGTVS